MIDQQSSAVAEPKKVGRRALQVPAGRWLTINEAAAELRCSTWKINQLVAAGKLTPHWPTGIQVFDRRELDRLVELSPTSSPPSNRGAHLKRAAAAERKAAAQAAKAAKANRPKLKVHT